MINDRIKNMGCIRNCAALSVIFSHSFLIGEGTEDREPLQSATGEILGIYGVFTFFIISGFLVTKSCFTSRTTCDFLWKRFLRIYPAYFVSLLVCILIIAPFYIEGSFSLTYLRSSLNSLINGMLIQNNILYVEGVSIYDSDIGGILNGVYWTIKVEVILYILLLLLYKTKTLTPSVTVTLSLVTTTFFVLDLYPSRELWGILFGAPGFFAGSFIYFLSQKSNFSPLLSLAFLGLMVASTFFNLTHKVFPILAAYPIMHLGFAKVPNLDQKINYADYSYGIYLFGWPIQQIARSMVGEAMSGWYFFLISAPIIIAFSALSWRFIEKPCLKFKSWKLNPRIG